MFEIRFMAAAAMCSASAHNARKGGIWGFETLADARAYVKKKDLKSGDLDYFLRDLKTGKRYEIVARPAQARRRSTPEGKAKEALASRRSYWKKRLGGSRLCEAGACPCICDKARAAGVTEL
jgi:hypothetical protein